MPGQTILIVEDNPTNRKLLEAVLRRFNYRLLLAENGEEGLEIAFREKPDLVLMDIQLPRLNGLDAIRAIRANPDVAATPIVALSAHAMADERAEAYEAGCDGYLTKPIDTRSFHDQIKPFLKEA